MKAPAQDQWCFQGKSRSKAWPIASRGLKQRNLKDSQFERKREAACIRLLTFRGVHRAIFQRFAFKKRRESAQPLSGRKRVAARRDPVRASRPRADRRLSITQDKIKNKTTTYYSPPWPNSLRNHSFRIQHLGEEKRLKEACGGLVPPRGINSAGGGKRAAVSVPEGAGRRLTCVHVAAVVAAESPPASPAASDVAASSPPAHVGRRGHLVVHGASHPETRVVLLREGKAALAKRRLARRRGGNRGLARRWELWSGAGSQPASKGRGGKAESEGGGYQRRVTSGKQKLFSVKPDGVSASEPHGPEQILLF